MMKKIIFQMTVFNYVKFSYVGLAAVSSNTSFILHIASSMGVIQHKLNEVTLI